MLIAKLPWRQTFPKHHPRISILELRTVRYISQRPPHPVPPFPTIRCCPPGSECLHPTPSNVGIDTEKPLLGTAPPYKQHVVICTGKDDWASRIEKEEGPNFARGLKELVGPKGEFYDPYSSVLITNSSFPPDGEVREKTQTHSQEGPSIPDTERLPLQPSANLYNKNEEFVAAFLFPSFQYIPRIRNTPDGHRAFVQDFLLPARNRQNLPNKDPTSQTPPVISSPTTTPTNPPPPSSLLQPIILICGHGTRDRRCGLFGPLLRAEFQHHSSNISSSIPAGNIALISHIGGHAFAGNVIIYIPPGFRHLGPQSQTESEMTTPEVSKLAGTGIWYGRVEPRHVAGILDATVGRGTIIEELFRGGVTSNGKVLRLGEGKA